MKFLIVSLVLMSASAFAHERGNCWGGPYWSLMEKSQRICNWQEQVFEQESGMTCKLKHHNDPGICESICTDADGRVAAKLKTSMTYDCRMGTIEFRKVKKIWYR